MVTTHIEHVHYCVANLSSLQCGWQKTVILPQIPPKVICGPPMTKICILKKKRKMFSLILSKSLLLPVLQLIIHSIYQPLVQQSPHCYGITLYYMIYIYGMFILHTHTIHICSSNRVLNNEK